MPPENVSLPGDDGLLTGYLVRPAGAGSFPAVVVIHEILGLNENIKGITNRFASAGYVALAVDLFTRLHPPRFICIARYMMDQLARPLNNPRTHDLQAALTFLADQAGVDAARLGAVGFCMGGGYAIAWACVEPRLKAIAPFYGYNPRAPQAVIARRCPVVASYPANDRSLTQISGRRLEKTLAAHGISHDIEIYSDTQHSFCNMHYDGYAAEDSWRRMLKFFDGHLTTEGESRP